MIGGALYDSVDYRGTCDFLAVSCCIYTIFYFIFNVGFDVFKDEKKRQDAMKSLRDSKNIHIEDMESKDDMDIEVSEEEVKVSASEYKKLRSSHHILGRIQAADTLVSSEFHDSERSEPTSYNLLRNEQEEEQKEN